MGLIWTFFSPLHFVSSNVFTDKGNQMREHFGAAAAAAYPQRLWFVTSWAIPCCLLWTHVQERLQLFTSFKKQFYFNQRYHTLQWICTDLVSFLVFPIFELMTVEHKNFEDSFGSTCVCVWGGGWLVISLCLNAGCCNHSFLYGEKKLFALNSLLEENGFTFLECVRTPWQGWNINRI